MPWFKVDDTFPLHAKVMAAGNGAIGLWTRAGAWSMQQLTDGFIPTHVARTLGSATEAKRLVTVGLWVEEEGGYRFHQWDSRQPSREKVEAERHAAAERQRLARERAKSRRESQQQSRRDDAVSHGPPDPTRPDPTQTTGADAPISGASADAEREFEEWYAAYPRKRGKGQAAKAYRAARKKADATTLLAAVQQQAPTLTARGPEFCPHPATWLNGERWDDEPDNVRRLPPGEGPDDWMRRTL